MTAYAPYEGESVPSIYGHCVRQPTGMGHPDYKPGQFSVDRPVVKWCDEAGCPESECVHCKAMKR